jgi:hypothetical protein
MRHHPEKYALHKLLVYGERPQAMRVKATKDSGPGSLAHRVPSDKMMQTFWERPGKTSSVRAQGWRSRAEFGLAALKARYPALDTSAMPMDGSGCGIMA